MKNEFEKIIAYHWSVGKGVPVASTTISSGSPSGAHIGSNGLVNFGGSYRSDFSITTISSVKKFRNKKFKFKNLDNHFLMHLNICEKLYW